MSTTRERGQAVETAALAMLQRQGLQLVTRNYRCRAGEVDLVMRDGGTLVFVEVRYRASARFGTPAATIDQGKQLRLTRAAEHYLAHASVSSGTVCRFDVIAASPAVTPGEAQGVRLEWVRDAFDTGTWGA